MRRQLSGGISQPVLKSSEGVLIYDATNKRHRQRELGRYLGASAADMQHEQLLTLCGPDGSKIGTSLSLTIAAIMAASSGHVALCVPQVFAFYGFLVTS